MFEKRTSYKSSQQVPRQMAAWIIGGATCVFVVGAVLMGLNAGQASSMPTPTATPLLIQTSTPSPTVPVTSTMQAEAPTPTPADDEEPTEKSDEESEDEPQSEASTIPMPEDPMARNGMYSAPPPMVIEPETKTYTATIVTEKGEIVLELFDDRAPKTVNNFVFLAREGFYDNTTFHRVIEDFMAQAGDPTGTGMGGPGYSFKDEFHPELKHDAPGTLSMANSGPDTNGSQFFITFGPTPWLDAYDEVGELKDCQQPRVSCHAVFGRVTEGMDVLMSISVRDPAQATEPGDLIETIRITEEGPGAEAEKAEETDVTPTAVPPTETPMPTPTPTENTQGPTPTTESPSSTIQSEVVLESFAELTGVPYNAGETAATYPGPTTGVRWLPALGAEDAPMTVIEFSSISCGHCATLTLNALDDLLQDYVATGDVRYVGHFIGGQASLTAELCAAEQGKYFAYKRAEFQNQSVDTIEDLDIAAFNACREENLYQETAVDASRHASTLGVSGTPTFIIRTETDEQMVVGNRPDELRRVIDEMLSAVSEQ